MFLAASWVGWTESLQPRTRPALLNRPCGRLDLKTTAAKYKPFGIAMPCGLITVTTVLKFS